MNNLTFIFKLLNGQIIDSQELLSKLSFYIPTYKTRCPLIFRNKFHGTNHGNAKPYIDRCTRIVNELQNVDIFSNSLYNIVSSLY